MAVSDPLQTSRSALASASRSRIALALLELLMQHEEGGRRQGLMAITTLRWADSISPD